MNFIGNAHIKEYFLKLLEQNNLGHAYLFYGAEGVGKKTFTLNFADQLFKGNGSTQFTTENHPDLFLIDKNSEIYIDETRKLKDFLYLTPVFSNHRVAVINNVHNLNQAAANAILKILEEPPKHSVLFLITHLPDYVLPTISSRCEKIHFLPLKKEQITGYLKKLGFKNEVTAEAAKFSAGSLSVAHKLAENLDKFKDRVKLLYKLAASDYNFRFSFSKKEAEDGSKLKSLLNDWIIYLNGDLAELENEKLIKRKEILKNAIELNKILSFSYLNHRLAFDNFLLKL